MHKILKIFGPKTAFIPVIQRTKKPAVRKWTKIGHQKMDDPYYLKSLTGQNIAINCGEKSGGLISIDCDEDGLLDDYERGDEAFTDFVAEVIGESFYDYDWIEQSTQRFDHKRGWTDLSMELSAPLGHFKEEFYNSNPLPSWTCQVRDGKGNLVTLAA